MKNLLILMKTFQNTIMYLPIKHVVTLFIIELILDKKMNYKMVDATEFKILRMA
ncbi:hypothetical protein [Flavobacterium psychrotolerans]|uniref:hypothetical protein n=1 Tax=Flavobacterium psychrotolerans TaxID=2169410 RepID=UPI00140C7215|nr:hypothetical protein [Flavobacterium psychrotolerans]